MLVSLTSYTHHIQCVMLTGSSSEFVVFVCVAWPVCC